LIVVFALVGYAAGRRVRETPNDAVVSEPRSRSDALRSS
jgi:hypothetical protein